MSDTGGLKKYSKKSGGKVVFSYDRWGDYDASKVARIEAPKGNELKEMQLPIPHCCY